MKYLFVMVCKTLLCYLSHLTIFKSEIDLPFTTGSFQDGSAHSVISYSTLERLFGYSPMR